MYEYDELVEVYLINQFQVTQKKKYKTKQIVQSSGLCTFASQYSASISRL